MGKTGRLYLCALVTVIFVLASCGRKHEISFTAKERHEIDSIVKSLHSMDRLDSIHQAMRKQQNLLGQIIVLREWGKQLRNESRFDEALEKHGEGLELAEHVGDTLEWVQALNNIGTDYRRMGILDAAQKYHKNALIMAEECSDTSFTACKNRVISLNGLANVYLTVQNFHLADSCLRQALAGEKSLGSITGQAINCANLGSIFETKGQTDSAWIYYKKSMELNTQDGNTLGIALCHTYFGNLYEKAHQLDKALAEYNKAYHLMKSSKDQWHTLNSLIAIAGVYITKGDCKKAESFLTKAKDITTSIHSTEHLAQIYDLYYKLCKKRGDWRSALLAHERSAALQDSLIDMEKVNRMQSVSFNIEHEQYTRHVATANNKITQERLARHTGYAIFAVIIFFLAVIIGLLIYNRKLSKRGYEALKKLNDIRETFFRNVTHEFRTPLTVILGLSHDLQKDSITTDEAHDMGMTIERQGNRILRLINQLLDISKIRSAIGKPEWRNGNIVAYISMIVEMFEDYSRKRDIKLQFIPHENEIYTDFVPEYMNKLMSNLLSNAIKFTPALGKVSISLWRNGRRLHIVISDTGCGISKENLPHIFEEFYQADNNEKAGTGIGLALVYQIVKQLDGTISVESTEGKGTTFHIVLQIKAESKTSHSIHKEEPKAISLGNDTQTNHLSDSPHFEESVEGLIDSSGKVSILIIEDNADVATYIGRQLGIKYNVLYARNGEEGFDLAHKQQPDAIVTDLMMPKMDGMELMRKIRSDELTSHIPIVVVTARVTEADRLRGLEAGADAYLTKPFCSDELLTRIDKLLEQRTRLQKKLSQMILSNDDKPNTQTPSPASEVRREVPFVNRVTDCIYVILNSGKLADVNTVAERLNMSYSQFYRKLTAITGLTPVQYIQRTKVAKAKLMLTKHPEMSFNAVADQCGFTDYSNFVRAFRNVLNITPTQFVRQITNSPKDGHC